MKTFLLNQIGIVITDVGIYQILTFSGSKKKVRKSQLSKSAEHYFFLEDIKVDVDLLHLIILYVRQQVCRRMSILEQAQNYIRIQIF